MDFQPTPSGNSPVKVLLPTSRKAQELLGAYLRESDDFPYLCVKQSPTVETASRKESFRTELMNSLLERWQTAHYDSEFLLRKFTSLLNTLTVDRATLFSRLIDKVKFKFLIAAYDQNLCRTGSENFLHSYINLAKHPDFLTDKTFNMAFLHPLLVLMVSYSMGGAVRVSDARGKDTPPVPAQAGDNMLHIDNTPFLDEYKINLCWHKGAPVGPNGQCFAFVPGTHHGTRRLRSDPRGVSFSVQNDGIFTTKEAICGLWEFQKENLGRPPTIVECKYPESPLSIVFDAGSLVHHRYRNQNETSRSCVILTFRRFRDDPGRIVKDDLNYGTPLSNLLVSYEGSDYDSLFLDLLGDCSGAIADKLAELENGSKACLLNLSSPSLTGQRLSDWLEATTSARSVTEIKSSRKLRLLEEALDDMDLFFNRLCEIITLDKYGRLNLIFHADGHEQIRKSARVRVREMSPREIRSRLKPKVSLLACINVQDWILAPSQVCSIANELAATALQAVSAGSLFFTGEMTGSADEFKSINQLLIDLGESVVRCASLECLCSTALFLFWSADDLVGFLPHSMAHNAIKQRDLLFKNYVATTLLVEAST